MSEAISKRNRFGHRQLVLFAVALVVYFALAYDERHHWHEWRYLYSAANYSVEDLRWGAFDPGPPPERSADEVGAWYWGQLLHESILAAIIRPLGPGLLGVTASQWVYGAWVPLAVLFGFLTLRKLNLRIDPGRVAVLALLSPLGIYVGFKLMAEGPGLALASAGMWLFTEAVSRRGALRLALLCVAAFLTALSFLAMVYLPLLMLGFLFAWALCLAERSGITRWIAPLLVVILAAVFSFLIANLLYDLWPNNYLMMYAFYGQYSKPLAVSIFGVLTAWSALYCFVFLAIKTREKKTLAFFALWLTGSLMPLILFSANYVESRFLTVGLFPLAGLSVLGLDWVGERLSKTIPTLPARGVCWLIVLVLVPSISWLSLPIMPFEMNAGEIRNIVTRARQQDAEGAILVPWNYTDFHYLRVAFPRAPVFLVQAPVNQRDEVVENSRWRARRERTYGERFIPDDAALTKQLGGRTLYYLGHGILPPFQNLKVLASGLGLNGISRRIDRLNPMNPLTHSWMWRDPRFIFHEQTGAGNYKLYRVERRISSSSTTAPSGQ